MTIVSTASRSFLPAAHWPRGEGVGTGHAFEVIAAFAIRLRDVSTAWLRTDAMDDCEAVIRARLDLAYCMIENGWRPSQRVSDGMRQDELLLAEGNGASEKLATAPRAE